MKSLKIQGIEWFVDDEKLIPVLEGITISEGGRRGYVSTEYYGGKVFIKSFAEKGLPGFIRNRVASRGKREYTLGNRLLSLSIPTPKPLGYGMSRMGSYVIQQWIEGGSLMAAFKQYGCNQTLMKKLADLSKALKIHHIRHNDLHLDNILIADGVLFLIDLHKMKIKVSFTIQDEISNLSHVLVNVYNELDTAKRESFFVEYGNPGIQEPVEWAMERLAVRWIRKKKERAFQETSMIVSRENRFYRAGMEDRAVGDLKSIIKADRKVRVERHSDHIRKVYMNRRRLEKAWRTHVVLAYMELAIVPPVFYVQLPGDNQLGSIAMEDLQGKGQELDRFLDRRYDEMPGRERRLMADNLAGFFLMLTRKKIVHKDLKACNIFVLNCGGFMLLDVEDIRFKALDEEALKRLLVQLNTTIPKRIRLRDRIRFFIKFTSPMMVNKRAIFKAVAKESATREIAYEGAGGFKREEW